MHADAGPAARTATGDRAGGETHERLITSRVGRL